MTVTYGDHVPGDDYMPRFSDGRPMFVGLKGEALTARESGKLLADCKKRRIGKTIIRYRGKVTLISTVFLVLDHGFMSTELYETMVFGGSVDGYQERYATRREAKAGHRSVARAVRIVADAQDRIRARRRRMHANYRARKA